jgi:hypothetical protein
VRRAGSAANSRHVQHDFVLRGCRGVERAIHRPLLAVGGERGFQVARVRLLEQLQVHDADPRFQPVEQWAHPPMAGKA